MQIVDVVDRDREKEAMRHFLSHLFFRMDLLKPKSGASHEPVRDVDSRAQRPTLRM